MSEDEKRKQRTVELSALMDRFQRKELSLIEVVMRAYSMGHDDATAAWANGAERLAAALGAKL